MAVLIEAISVVVKMSALFERYPGGWEAFRDNAPNQTLCADGQLARVGFMTPVDVEAFIEELESDGLVYLLDGDSQDIVVADQQRGFDAPCSWAECGDIEINGNSIKACQAVGDDSHQLMYPDGWQFEGSLSQTYIFAPSEEVDKSLKFLRNEDGLDVYLNMMTGKEVFLGRTNTVMGKKSKESMDMYTPGKVLRKGKRYSLTVASADHPIYKRGFVVGGLRSSNSSQSTVGKNPEKNVAKPKSLERSVISRDQAYEIAKQDALDNELGFNVNGVFLPEEIASALPVIYGVPLENCWVAYIKSPEPLGLRSSIIIIVDRESGEVIYRGSANDEG